MNTTIDESKLEELSGQMLGHMTGAMVCTGVWLGDELGLYRVLAGAGPLDAATIADRSGCNQRLIREWLDGQTAAGLIAYDEDGDRYELSPEAAAALADEESPAFVAKAMNTFAAFIHAVPKLVDAYRGDGALAWGDHHPCLFAGTEWLFRPGYKAMLPDWLAALDGVTDKLAAGGSAADIGCGHGASSIVIATKFPSAEVHGFDFHGPSIETARQRARDAGAEANTEFAVASSSDYPGSYDLVCFFDCLHDMGDPVGIARHAREHLNPGGTVMLVEPFALADRPTNMRDNPLAPLAYHASSFACTPNSLSQEVGLGLGAQAGEGRLAAVFAEAGYSSFRRVAETPLNLVLEARV